MSEVARQFAMFVLVGAVGTSAHYALMIGLVELAAVNPVQASAAGFVVGAIVNYLGMAPRGRLYGNTFQALRWQRPCSV